MKIIEELLLEILRKWASSSRTCDASDGELSLAGLDDNEMAQFDEKVWGLRVSPVVSQTIADWSKAHLVENDALRQRQSRQLAAIEMLAEASEKRGVRFVLFKGVASAVACYGDSAMRDSSDVDVLIDPRDIAQFDLILKSIGFFQAAQLGSVALSNKLAAKYLQAAYSNRELPPAKRKTYDVQYQPYYSNSLGVRVEVHDGVYYVPSSYTPELLWRTRMLELPGCSVRQLDLEHTLVVLILTTYENSESVYAGLDGEVSLRDYCDIMSFFKLRGCDLDKDKFREIARNLGIEGLIVTVSSNLQAIFGFTPLGEIGFGCNVGADTDGQAFLGRLFDRRASRAHAKSILKERVLNARTVIHEGETVSVDTIYNLGVEIRVRRDCMNLVAEWMLPKSMEHEFPFLGLQLGIVPTANAPYVEGVASIRNASKPEGAIWHASRRICQMLAVPGRSEAALEVFEAERGSTVIIGVVIPLRLVYAGGCAIGIVPMVYVQAANGLYRTVNTSSSHFEYPWLLSPQGE